LSEQRPFEVALLGATGFTGGLVAEYLARHAPADLRWTLAGRNLGKLEAVRDRLAALDGRWANLPLTEARSDDPVSMQALAASCKVVASTVGPFLQLGEPLVAACAAAGTDYADITGEPEFVDVMYARYQRTALANQARLVHCCGFDSIPSDLGALFTARHCPPQAHITLRGAVRLDGAAFSSGTMRSALGAAARPVAMWRAARQRRKLERELEPAQEPVRVTLGWPSFDGSGGWLVPMPTIDPQIVARSARTMGGFGSSLTYTHMLRVPHLWQVFGLPLAVAALLLAAQVGPLRRRLLERYPLGKGPSAEQRAHSSFAVDFTAMLDGSRSKVVRCRVSGGDPGYTETSMMLAESALSLARDALPQRFGQLTPAAAMGEALLERLQRGGMRFEVVEGVG
jgi:saccharopine dehydrogenase (NAD+, L-glutamate forming)